MQISFGPARALDDGVWTGMLSAAEARRLPGAPLRSGGPHVVILTAPAWNGAELRAPFDGVSVVALGAGERAIFLAATAAAAPLARASAAETPPANPATTAPSPAPTPEQTATDSAGANDDAAFVAACAEIGPKMERVARALIARVRATYAGALKRQTNPRLFVETPDNFWSVEVQPRCRTIKRVVRTDDMRFCARACPTKASARRRTSRSRSATTPTSKRHCGFWLWAREHRCKTTSARLPNKMPVLTSTNDAVPCHFKGTELHHHLASPAAIHVHRRSRRCDPSPRQ